METIFMNTENSRTNKSNKFCCYFSDKLSLKDPNENFALVKLSIFLHVKKYIITTNG